MTTVERTEKALTRCAACEQLRPAQLVVRKAHGPLQLCGQCVGNSVFISRESVQKLLAQRVAKAATAADAA
jgi:hypothetical protein